MQLCAAFESIHRKRREDEHRTGHTICCNGCQDAVANPDILGAILESGKIPLIISIDDYNKNVEKSFLVNGSDTSYVAIAHVWPDNLGNLQRNSCSARVRWCRDFKERTAMLFSHGVIRYVFRPIRPEDLIRRHLLYDRCRMFTQTLQQFLFLVIGSSTTLWKTNPMQRS